jgi:signal transduction histidine kinase
VSSAAADACFAQHVADLRNGLTPLVLLRAELARALAAQREAPAWLASWARCLGASLDDMVAKVRALSDFPQVVASGVRLEPTDVDLAGVVREVCARREPLASASGSALRVAAASAVSGKWDRHGLFQIVDRLVANAIHHSDRSPIDVAVTAVARHATVAVTGHLPGGASPGDSAGGVELWPVRLLCEGMGGGIAISERGASRACFTVTLPR